MSGLTLPNQSAFDDNDHDMDENLNPNLTTPSNRPNPTNNPPPLKNSRGNAAIGNNLNNAFYAVANINQTPQHPRNIEEI